MWKIPWFSARNVGLDLNVEATQPQANQYYGLTGEVYNPYDGHQENVTGATAGLQGQPGQLPMFFTDTL